MTLFDTRDKAFENKFALEQELAFKVMSHSNKLLGAWAAEKLGKTGADAEAYTHAVVLAEFESGGQSAIIAKLLEDFIRVGIAVSEKDIRGEMEHLLLLSRKQIIGE